MYVVINLINTARSFENLIVWRRAHQFVLSLYGATERLHKNELFGLTAQMRRAAISIPANIAEGFKKRGVKDKICLLNVAQGSVEESQYYLILSHDLPISGRPIPTSEFKRDQPTP